MDDEDFIELSPLPKKWKTPVLTKDQIKFINRGSNIYEPTEFQLK